MEDSSTPVVEPPHSPVMDVLPPNTNSEALALPPPEAADSPAKPAGSHDVPDQPDQPSVATKPAGNRATSAIVATVIIVLGLAAMATYAYLKQK